MNNKFEQLVDLFSTIPSISSKQASKILLKLIKQEESKDLLRNISELYNEVNICKKCNIIFSSSKCQECERENNKLLVLENNLDFLSLKNNYRNLNFFIFNNITKRYLNSSSTIEMDLDRLISYINKRHIEEVIFSFSPTIESELVLNIIREKLIVSIKGDIKLTKIGIGVSFGSKIEYLDEKSIKESIKHRESI